MVTLKQLSDTFLTPTSIRVILGGLAIQLVLGYFYLWAPISAYITSYYRQTDQNLSNEFTNRVQPSLGLSKALTMPIGAYISSKLGYRRTTILFSIILFLAFFHSSLCHGFWYFFFDYAIIGGIVNGCLVMLPIYQIQKYFTNYKGVATGIVFSGYGLGSIIWSQISFRIINPKNLKAVNKIFPKEVSDNVPDGLKALGLIFCISLIISSIIAFVDTNKEPKEKNQQQEIKKDQETKPFVATQPPEQKSQDKTYTQLLLSKSYAAIVTMAMLTSLFPMMFIASYKTFYLNYHNDDKFLTNIVVTCTSFANGSARVVWGIIYDKFGFHNAFMIILILQLIASLFCTSVAASQIGFTIIVSILFFCQGGTFLLFPLYILEHFGQNDGQKIYGFVHYAFAIANFIQYYILFYLKDLNKVLAIFFVANLAAFLIKVLFNQKKKKEQ